MFVLNAKLYSIYALIVEVFGDLNLVSLSVFLYQSATWSTCIRVMLMPLFIRLIRFHNNASKHLS